MTRAIEVLIPAHNEHERIGATVAAALGIGGVTRVLVVDDGSSDDTANLARAAGAEVLTLAENSGKGAALERGAERLERSGLIVLLDGDLGDTASQAAALISPILAGNADMSIATFPPPARKAGFGLVKSLARWGIRHLGSRSFDPQAPLSGQRAMTAECLEGVRPFASGYGVEIAMTVRALRQGARVVEVPTRMAHAATGRDASGFAHRGRQFVHVAAAILDLLLETPKRDHR